MMTAMVTLIQIAERAGAATQGQANRRFVPRRHTLLPDGGRLLQRMASRGFRSRVRMSSVSVPDVDFRSGRSSSV